MDVKLLSGLMLLLIACSTGRQAGKQQQTIKLAFGSCNDVTKPNLLWDDILQTKPDTWIWLGDNIYGSPDNLNLFSQRYDLLAKDSGYNKITSFTQVEGIWDDGDYGPNNGGKEFAAKDSVKKMLLDFLKVPDNDERRFRPGIYYSRIISKGTLTVKLILLDGRYFRDSLIYQKDSIVPNPIGDMLGVTQWAWLENELKMNNTDVTVIASGVQVLASGHRFEKWSNFPASKAKLLNLLKKYNQTSYVFISGDRHIGEITRISWQSHKQAFLYDITSSSLTSPWQTPRKERNDNRKGNLVYPVNFGLLTISNSQNGILKTATLLGDSNKVFEETEW